MRERWVPKLSILDLMILVASAAIGLGGLVAAQVVYAHGTPRKVPAIPGDVSEWVIWLSFQGVLWAWALLLMKLRRTRASRLRLLRRPGFITCVSITLTSSARAVFDLAGHRLTIFPSFPVRIFYAWAHSAWPFTIAEGLIIGWAITLLGGKVRRPDDWIDILGALLGALWLVAAFWLAWLDW